MADADTDLELDVDPLDVRVIVDVLLAELVDVEVLEDVVVFVSLEDDVLDFVMVELVVKIAEAEDVLVVELLKLSFNDGIELREAILLRVEVLVVVADDVGNKFISAVFAVNTDSANIHNRISICL